MTELEALAHSLYGKKILYQPIEHPAFSNWKVDRPCTDRLKAIFGVLGNVKDKLGLDVGCCTGWFCHKLAEKGAKMVGVDTDHRRIRIAKILSDYYGFNKKNPLFLCKNFQDYLTNAPNFGFVLFLNLLNHLINKNPEKAWKDTDLISRHTSTMFMDMGTYNIPMKLEEIPEIITERTEFSKYKVLQLERMKGTYHPDKPERPLYVFLK